MIRLTDEEIIEATQIYMFIPNGELDLDCGFLRGRQQVANAQLKKAVEWGNEECDCDVLREHPVRRHFCPRCWLALQKEVKND